MTEDEMKTKFCHKTIRGEAVNIPGNPPDTFFPTPAKCFGSECVAFRTKDGNAYCAELKRDA